MALSDRNFITYIPAPATPSISIIVIIDLIFANILANPLCRLAPNMAKYTKKNGIIILSGILNVQVTGDTRFDRVLENSNNHKIDKTIRRFLKNSNNFIIGSSWMEDNKLLLSSCDNNTPLKLSLIHI